MHNEMIVEILQIMTSHYYPRTLPARDFWQGQSDAFICGLIVIATKNINAQLIIGYDRVI